MWANSSHISCSTVFISTLCQCQDAEREQPFRDVPRAALVATHGPCPDAKAWRASGLGSSQPRALSAAAANVTSCRRGRRGVDNWLWHDRMQETTISTAKEWNLGSNLQRHNSTSAERTAQDYEHCRLGPARVADCRGRP